MNAPLTRVAPARCRCSSWRTCWHGEAAPDSRGRIGLKRISASLVTAVRGATYD